MQKTRSLKRAIAESTSKKLTYALHKIFRDAKENRMNQKREGE